ncbi:MOSC domain-containing protein [Rhizobium skierniewicense]|uniref:MOSC domain-containing protein n=1 Tax=Rhizobium skierniewicense TaxID=984260 RepID=UPI00307ED59C
MNDMSAGTVTASQRRTMKQVGRIAELWRYPVSSLGGETCHTVNVDMNGIVGDREFGIFDTSTGLAAAPEKDVRWRSALFLRSTLDENGLPRIHFPDGAAVSVIDKTVLFRLSNHFGFDVGIGRYARTNLPEAAGLPIISNRYDPSPLHIITTQSLRTLARLASLDEMNQRRFRPSVLIETGSPDPEESGFIEESWLGATLRLGAQRVQVSEKAKRCGMTLIAQPELTEQPEILRTLVRRNARNFGIYCHIPQPGTLTVEANVNLEVTTL